MTRPPDFRASRIVVAVPTIAAREEYWAAVHEAWTRHTCQPVEVIFTTAGDSWAAGLNAVALAALGMGADAPGDVFVCGSDDMLPADDLWLPPLRLALEQGLYPAPCVIDPRFTSYGGEHRTPVPDGTPAGMSSFPILRGDWLELVFPLPEDLHYYSDNLVALLLARAGFPCVAVPSARIQHLHAREGRGCGYQDEPTRMLVDSVRYTRELDQLGIDRASLPAGQRGGLWEESYLERGRAIETAG